MVNYDFFLSKTGAGLGLDGKNCRPALEKNLKAFSKNS